MKLKNDKGKVHFIMVAGKDYTTLSPGFTSLLLTVLHPLGLSSFMLHVLVALISFIVMVSFIVNPPCNCAGLVL